MAALLRVSLPRFSLRLHERRRRDSSEPFLFFIFLTRCSGARLEAPGGLRPERVLYGVMILPMGETSYLRALLFEPMWRAGVGIEVGMGAGHVGKEDSVRLYTDIPTRYFRIMMKTGISSWVPRWSPKLLPNLPGPFQKSPQANTSIEEKLTYNCLYTGISP